MQKIFFIFFIAIFTLIHFSQAQNNNNKGTEFWIGGMKSIANYDLSYGVTIYSDKAITGTISIPAYGWSKNFSFPANGYTIINIPSQHLYPINTGIYPYGILVETSDSAWVNANGVFMEDYTTVLPIQALSNEYIINIYGELNTELFLIVAVDDGTTVEIIPPDSTSFSIQMKKGEMYQYERKVDVTKNLMNHLSGFRIKASSCRNKVAVFAGATCSGIKGIQCHQFYEQVPPIQSLGKEFLVVNPYYQNKLLDGSNSLYTIVATEDSTILSLNGATLTLNQGETHEALVNGEFYLKADKPVSVAHFPYFQNPYGSYTPFMLMVSPIESKIFNSDFTVPNLLSYGSYITIFTETSNASNIYIDSVNLNSADFTVCSYNTSYSYIQYWVSYTSWSDLLHNIHSSGGFTAYLSAWQNSGVNIGRSSYGYTLGFGYPLSPQEKVPDFSVVYAGDTTDYKNFNTKICSCAPLEFIVNDPSQDLIYQWKFHDGSLAYGPKISHHYLNGDFQITLSTLSQNGCEFKHAILDHIIVENCDISMSPTTPVCAEDSVELRVSAGSTFRWNTGETSQSIKVSPDQTKLYSVVVDNGGTGICDSIIVYVKGSKPVINLGPDTTICKGASKVINAAYDQAYYLWQDGSTKPTYTISEKGLYSVTTTNLCGSDQDTVEFNVINIPTVELGPNTGICLGETIDLCAVMKNVDTFLWNTGSKDTCIQIIQPGTYKLNVSNSCFKKSGEVIVKHNVCKELFIPNLLTPNKDGLNDFFVILNIEERDCTLSIFNRWGEKVYEEEHYANQWNVSSLEDGVYYYVLEDHTTQTNFKGWLNVMSESKSR